ncbi:ribosomal RNA processing protein 1 homolog Nnp-1 [Rhodnius prolixus]|uniref:Putative nucleolar protein n=1 Tax=Rhodnius prolixus TaxID=13249 RepID=R4FKG2_RHOPR
MKDKPSDQLLQIAQEITFAKALACNDKTLRVRALRRLKKWLISKSNVENGITQDGFIRLWRGLFYNVWMSDKPLVQEEVVEAISNLIHCFSNFSEAQTFIMCFFQTLSESWFGLDSHRLDKYLMFVRRFLRQSFVLAENYEWKSEHLMELIASFKKAFLKAPLGLLMHVCEIYLEELAKVTKGKLDEDILLEFIKPFGEIMSTSSDVRLIKHIEEFIYMHLLKQSDLGIKHQIKFKAWRKLGCPEGDINVMEEVEVNSEEESTEELKESNFSLDARAGNVDVFLPPIKFNAIAIADHLTALRKHKNTKTKARKRLTDIINKYKTFVRGKYPLGIHKVELVELENEEEIIEEAAMELLEDELETYNEDKLRKPVKKKAKKEELSPTGEWIVTPLKESASNNKGVKSRRNICNNWEVSKISDTPCSTNDSMNLRKDSLTTVSINGKNELKKRKKILKTSKRVSPDKDQFHLNNSEELEKQTNVTTTNEWGDVSWDDQQQTEILVEPKKKFKQTLDLSLKKKSTQNHPTGNKVKTSTPSSGKKVEFVLNRNSVQAEEDYKLSLKKNPVLKFNSEAQPPVGVLKSTPFSSPINPFVLLPNAH